MLVSVLPMISKESLKPLFQLAKSLEPGSTTDPSENSRKHQCSFPAVLVPIIGGWNLQWTPPPLMTTQSTTSWLKSHKSQLKSLWIMSNGSLMNKGRLNLLQEKSPRKKESSFPNAMSTIRRCQPAMSLTSLHRRFCPTTTFWSDETVKTLWLDWCENWILLLKGQIAPLFVVDSSNVFKVQSNVM